MTTTSVPAVAAFARRRPLTAFSIAAFGLGWPLLAAITVLRLPRTSVGAVFTYGALLGSALVVSRLADGPGAARRLLAGLLRWRFGVGRWAVVVLAMPVLTVAVAAASGTLHTPPDGWLAATGAYLFATLVTGALEVNLAEETAWSGFVQARLTRRHGLLRGALLTAPLFALMHLPLQFEPGWTWGGVAAGVLALVLVAPIFRYVLGDHLAATGGSLLAVGVQHASFNASGDLVSGGGGWQVLPALLVLAIVVAVVRRVRSRSGALDPATPARTVPDRAALPASAS